MSISNIIKDPNTNWRYILIVLVLGILVGGGILGYQEYTARKETPTPTSPIDETADWKVYRNEEYGFELKYPIAAEKKEGNHYVFELDLAPTQIKWNYMGLRINIVNLEDCFYYYLGQTIEKKGVTVNNLNFCLNVEEDSGAGSGVSRNYYYTIKKGGVNLLLDFYIEYNKNCGLYPEFPCEKLDEVKDTKIFDQILSTFQFLDPVRE